SRRRHTRFSRDWSSDVCSSDLAGAVTVYAQAKTFTAVSGSGAVEIRSNGQINTTDFDLDLSGSSKVNLDLNAANVTTDASGSSRSEERRVGKRGEWRVGARLSV